MLYELAEDDNCGPGFAARFGVPLLGAFVERMAARPQIAAYLASPTRMPQTAHASLRSSAAARCACASAAATCPRCCSCCSPGGGGLQLPAVPIEMVVSTGCLLYTSDAADE